MKNLLTFSAFILAALTSHAHGPIPVELVSSKCNLIYDNFDVQPPVRAIRYYEFETQEVSEGATFLLIDAFPEDAVGTFQVFNNIGVLSEDRETTEKLFKDSDNMMSANIFNISYAFEKPTKSKTTKIRLSINDVPVPETNSKGHMNCQLEFGLKKDEH